MKVRKHISLPFSDLALLALFCQLPDGNWQKWGIRFFFPQKISPQLCTSTRYSALIKIGTIFMLLISKVLSDTRGASQL
jgi:hypothetical protein